MRLKDLRCLEAAEYIMARAACRPEASRHDNAQKSTRAPEKTSRRVIAYQVRGSSRI